MEERIGSHAKCEEGKDFTRKTLNQTERIKENYFNVSFVVE